MSRETTAGWDRSDSYRVLLVGLAALVIRLVYLKFVELPPYDPWRHLQLLDNLRAGRGFTLFDGQPYLWYSPGWHRLVAALPAFVRPEVVAAVLSAAAVPLAYAYLRAAESRSVARIAAWTLAACGPLVRFTCHYGPEAFALCLSIAALWLARARLAPLWAALAGLLYGVALTARLNFAFVAPLFVPGLRTPRRGLAFAAGTALPLGLSWWRNHSIIVAHDWVFTWDGLATRSADFNVLSTLVVQLHPAISAALRRLHEIIVPVPEWTRSVALTLFVALGVAAALAARRLWLGLTVAGTVFYFLVLDGGMSSNFFRIWIVLFFPFAYGVALTAERLARFRTVGPLLAIALTLAGAPMFLPPRSATLEAATPPEGFLDDGSYFVNSGFYHPESLIRRYPRSRFLGLPIEARQLESFLAAYPQIHRVVWHTNFDVQDEVRRALLARPGAVSVKCGRNAFGQRYELIELDAEQR